MVSHATNSPLGIGHRLRHRRGLVRDPLLSTPSHQRRAAVSPAIAAVRVAQTGGHEPPDLGARRTARCDRACPDAEESRATAQVTGGELRTKLRRTLNRWTDAS